MVWEGYYFYLKGLLLISLYRGAPSSINTNNSSFGSHSFLRKQPFYQYHFALRFLHSAFTICKCPISFIRMTDQIITLVRYFTVCTIQPGWCFSPGRLGTNWDLMAINSNIFIAKTYLKTKERKGHEWWRLEYNVKNRKLLYNSELKLTSNRHIAWYDDIIFIWKSFTDFVVSGCTVFHKLEMKAYLKFWPINLNLCESVLVRGIIKIAPYRLWIIPPRLWFSPLSG